MSGQSYAAETPCIQAVPAGTYRVTCSHGDQSRVFRVVADAGCTTCILWDCTTDGYSATTMVEGTGILLAYEEPENLHDDHTVIVDPVAQDGDEEGTTRPVLVIEAEKNDDDFSVVFKYVSALIGVIAAFITGLIIMKEDDKE